MSTIPYRVMPFQVRLSSEDGDGAAVDCACAKPAKLRPPNRTSPQPNPMPRTMPAARPAVFFGLFTTLLPFLRLLDLIGAMLHIYYNTTLFSVSFSQQSDSGRPHPRGGTISGRPRSNHLP